MLTIADDLSTLALAAGEPFLLDVQFKDANGDVPAASHRALVLSFYRTSNRETVKVIAGELLADETGPFFRFVREGTFSEELLGIDVAVELAERLRNGRYVVAKGTLSVATSASGVLSLDNAAIGRVLTRITVRDASRLGDPPIFSSQRLPYSDDANPPAPYWTTKPSLKDDGTPQVGEPIDIDFGVIRNGSVLSYRLLIGGSPIANATDPYIPIAADAGKALAVEVTARGPGGDRVEISPAILVAAATPPPTPTPTTANTLGDSTLLATQVSGAQDAFAPAVTLASDMGYL